MGTPDFAISSLEALLEHHEVVAVVSQPDKPKGRGKKIVPTPVKQVAIDKGITKIYQPEKIRDKEFIKILKELDADVFVVVAYGQILSQEVLDSAKICCINVHGSLLPKYRGAAPIQWAVINGEKKTGVTIMYMEKGLDCGDILLKDEIVIEKSDTYETLYDKMKTVGANALIKALDMLEKGKLLPEKQDDSQSTYAPMITKEMGHINFGETSKNIINLIRGLNPIPSAYTIYKGEKIKILEAYEIPFERGDVGEIVDIQKDGFVVKTKDSAIVVTVMHKVNSKKMKTVDYLKGNSIEKNIVLC